jgi:hypothetical protein
LRREEGYQKRPVPTHIFGEPSHLGVSALASDATYINFDGDGNVFVEDGADGLHGYHDLAAVPEPGYGTTFYRGLLRLQG